MAKGLTKRQQAILDFVMDYVQEEGYPPSIREIGAHFGIGSLRGVTVHLDALARKGYISRSNTPRSIKLIHPTIQPQSSRTVMVPLLGSIAAGSPIEAIESAEEQIPVPAEMVRNVRDAFLLRVKGDSMIGDGILPRDLVLIKPQANANNGDLIAAMIDGEATVKRYYSDSKGVQLLPSNPNYEPILVRSENSKIVGKVVGLIRDYSGMAF